MNIIFVLSVVHILRVWSPRNRVLGACGESAADCCKILRGNVVPFRCTSQAPLLSLASPALPPHHPPSHCRAVRREDSRLTDYLPYLLLGPPLDTQPCYCCLPPNLPTGPHFWLNRSLLTTSPASASPSLKALNCPPLPCLARRLLSPARATPPSPPLIYLQHHSHVCPSRCRSLHGGLAGAQHLPPLPHHIPCPSEEPSSQRRAARPGSRLRRQAKGLPRQPGRIDPPTQRERTSVCCPICR